MSFLSFSVIIIKNEKNQSVMIKSDYILNEESSFNKSIVVKDYIVRSVLAIIGLTGAVVGLPLMMSSLF